MKLLSTPIWSVVLLASSVMAHGDHSDPSPDYQFIDPENSLVDLVRQTKDTLKNFNWELSGATEFEEGRLILTPKPPVSSSDDEDLTGAVWSQHPVSFQKSTGFTFETTMRSVGATGNTGAGLSYWFISDSDASTKNFGGPTIFDGLQILFKEDSIKTYLSDGTKQSASLEAFSSCYLAFQDSDVPLTMRLSYSSDSAFKMTINNYLCFDTDKIKFDDLSNHRIGITAQSSTDFAKFEQYELFKFEVYHKITQEASQAVKGTLPSQPQVMTKVVTAKSSKPTASQMQAFAEKERKLREALIKSANTPATGSEIEEKIKLVESSNIEIMNKLDSIQSLISNTDRQDSTATSSNAAYEEVKSLLTQTQENNAKMVSQQLETNKLMDNLVLTLEQRITSLEEQLKKTSKQLEIVSGKIGTVTNDRHFNSIIAKLNEVDANQKSSLMNLNNGNSANEPLVSLQTKIKWIIICLFVVFVGIGYAILQLRGEIKHGKIL